MQKQGEEYHSVRITSCEIFWNDGYKPLNAHALFLIFFTDTLRSNNSYEDVADARANDPSLAFLKTIIP